MEQERRPKRGCRKGGEPPALACKSRRSSLSPAWCPLHGPAMAAAAMDLPWPLVRMGGRRGRQSKGSAGPAAAIAVMEDGGGVLDRVREEGRQTKLEVSGTRSGHWSMREEEGRGRLRPPLANDVIRTCAGRHGHGRLGWDRMDGCDENM